MGMKDRILLVSFSLKMCVYCYRSLRHFEIRLYCMNKFREKDDDLCVKLQCTYSGYLLCPTSAYPACLVPALVPLLSSK